MTTTHKTLRGPRGAIILCKDQDRLVDVSGLDEKAAKRLKSLSGKIDRAVFPGLQGGPHENVIAAKAICFAEALGEDFRIYSEQIVANAKMLAETLMNEGIKLVTDGTDNHLILIDLRSFGVGLGKEVAVALEKAGIVTNANTVPYDPSTPFKPSGVRIGTPALTTRGMKEIEMLDIGKLMAKVIKNYQDSSVLSSVLAEVEELCKRFPI